MNSKTVRIIDAWKLSNDRLIVELENGHGSLPKGTILKSETGKLSWTVQSRIISTHVADLVNRYPDEDESMVHLSFKSTEKRDFAIANMIRNNGDNIFQYQLEPNGSNEKPTCGMLLIVEETI